MDSENQENLTSASKKPQTYAYVNGKRVARAPRGGANRTRWNADIFWLLVLAAGELGQRGQGGTDGRLFDPASSSDPSDITKRLEKLKASRGAVAKWRRLNNVFEACPPGHRWVFRSRYRSDDKYVQSIRGFKAAFGDLATLVWDMTGLRDPENSTPFLKKALLEARRKTELTKEDARRKWGAIAKLEEGELQLEKYAARYPEDAPLLSSEATRAMLKSRLSHYKAGDPFVAWFKSKAEQMNRAAHLEWLRIEREQALDAKIPKASFL